MKEIILVLFFISSLINITSETDFKDIKEFIKDYYSIFVYKGEKKSRVCDFKKNEDREWIFEKLNFSDYTMENQVLFQKYYPLNQKCQENITKLNQIYL
ncbi:MAG: hypothetical protein WHV67_07500 [Thermoanaerobaculia bacterium]